MVATDTTSCGPCGNVLCSQYGCQKLKYQYAPPLPTVSYKPLFIGCICPPTSEQTCQNPTCPRGPSAHD